MQALFDCVSENGTTDATRIQARLIECGITVDDFRLRTTLDRLADLAGRPIDRDSFAALVGPELMMVNRVLQRQLVIPDWDEFCCDIQTIYDHVALDVTGANANYIPILRDADPEKWGVAICTVDRKSVV